MTVANGGRTHVEVCPTLQAAFIYFSVTPETQPLVFPPSATAVDISREEQDAAARSGETDLQAVLQGMVKVWALVGLAAILCLCMRQTSLHLLTLHLLNGFHQSMSRVCLLWNLVSNVQEMRGPGAGTSPPHPFVKDGSYSGWLWTVEPTGYDGTEVMSEAALVCNG